jgi:hypothetical protein
MSRKNLLPGTFALAILASIFTPVTQAADKDAVRIGFLTIKSGALAAGGKQMEDGLRLFLKQQHACRSKSGTVCGRYRRTARSRQNPRAGNG